jgi:hypothetical protein
MSEPSKVIGLLDLAGEWNPLLAFVMDGAVELSNRDMRFRVRNDTLEVRKIDRSWVIPETTIVPSGVAESVFPSGSAVCTICGREPELVSTARGDGFLRCLSAVAVEEWNVIRTINGAHADCRPSL